MAQEANPKGRWHSDSHQGLQDSRTSSQSPATTIYVLLSLACFSQQCLAEEGTSGRAKKKDVHEITIPCDCPRLWGKRPLGSATIAASDCEVHSQHLCPNYEVPLLVPVLLLALRAMPALRYRRALTQATAGLLTRDTNHCVLASENSHCKPQRPCCPQRVPGKGQVTALGGWSCATSCGCTRAPKHLPEIKISQQRDVVERPTMLLASTQGRG